MIVCTCTGTTDADIARLVGEGARSVSDIIQKTGAGQCCSPCREEIHHLVLEARESFGRARSSV